MKDLTGNGNLNDRTNKASQAYKVLQNYDLAFDIGTNVGGFSNAYHNKFNKIVAIEAHPLTYIFAKQNLSPYGNVEVIDSQEISAETAPKTGTFTPNPTSVGVTVNSIIEPVQSIVEKIPTPHLPDEARGVEPPNPIDEDELFDQAMRAQAEKDKQEFLRKRDDKQN